MEFIPDELLFEILMRLPAHDIYSGARLVCRKWYHMIRTHNFISTHFQQATYGLLIDNEHRGVDFISVRNGDIETYKLMNYKLRNQLWTSCNGLVLEDERSNETYCVANISTHQSLRLPPCPVSVNYPWTAGMGYAAASGTYKVFATRGVWRGIISVGVDESWRFISAEHLSPSAMVSLCVRPLVTEGYMHWIGGVGALVVTMNVETETITEAPLPVVGEKNRSIHCLSTGTCLSLLISCGELEWEVWEMKSETGEWRKLPNICLESEKGRMEGLGIKPHESLRPCGWVKYPEVLVFKIFNLWGVHNSLYFYNLVKREISSKKVETGGRYTIMHHQNSLVSPVGRRMLS